MLDMTTSAARLRSSLARLYEDWRAEDPRVHTKSELARRCSALTGLHCSPQTVNGWFKTGRMDKLWIKPVESVLGASLSFDYLPSPVQNLKYETITSAITTGDAAVDISTYKSKLELDASIQTIADVLTKLDGLKRKICAEAIKHLADHPDEAESVSSSIKSLLAT